MITLFGSLDSGNVHKVQLILRRVGVDYHRVDVAQTRNEPRSREFMQINPIGKVPAVILDDGRIISESGAILFHFASGTPLWPADLLGQTDVLRWMFFEQYSHEPSLAVMRYLRHYVPNPERHVERLRELEPRAQHALAAVETRLAASDWIAAGIFTIADYALYPYTRAADESGIDLEDYPAIRAWLERVERQPGFLSMRSDGAARTLTFDEYFSAGSS